MTQILKTPASIKNCEIEVKLGGCETFVLFKLPAIFLFILCLFEKQKSLSLRSSLHVHEQICEFMDGKKVMAKTCWCCFSERIKLVKWRFSINWPFLFAFSASNLTINKQNTAITNHNTITLLNIGKSGDIPLTLLFNHQSCNVPSNAFSGVCKQNNHDFPLRFSLVASPAFLSSHFASRKSTF